MESGVSTATSINSIVGQPGPTSCDLNEVMYFNTDYTCPGSGGTCDTQPTNCPEGQTWNPDTCRCGPSSPIVIDVGGKGFELTSAAGGVSFDISGSGHPIQMGWTAAGADNAFLALPGTDGLVHNGKQLFGDFTSQPPSANPNGFAALAVYDDPKNGGNGDGVIDSKDAVFSSLRLWIDTNHDGVSQPSELNTLLSLGVISISLNYRESRRQDQFGNVFRYRAQVNAGGNGSTGRMAYDVFFVNANSTAKNKCSAPMRRGSLLPQKAGGS